MRRLQWSVERRTQIAQMYRQFFAEQFVEADLSPLDLHQRCEHSWHLFVLQIDFTRLNVNRSEVMNALRAKGIGTQVHYIPVHLQPYYRTLYGHRQGDFPAAEQFYDRALSIPMYPTLSDDDVARVTTGFVDILKP
jgi:dTDP-4-amino-4,6-dideoxygalactose transaminase